MTTFQDLLQESYSELNEATMTSSQRKAVAALRTSGWRMVGDTEEVKLSNGIDTVTVDEMGQLDYLGESFASKDDLYNEMDMRLIKEAVRHINEEEEQQDEKQQEVKSLAQKMKILFDNLTIITMVRGSEVYIVTMSRNKNEFVKLDGGNVADNGDLYNRRTANNLVERLKASGFEEKDWKSVVPRSLMKSYKFLVGQTPTIAVLLLMYAVAPGVVLGILSLIIRIGWAVLGTVLNTLPFPSIQVFSDAVDGALESMGMGQPQVDGFTGAAP